MTIKCLNWISFTNLRSFIPVCSVDSVLIVRMLFSIHTYNNRTVLFAAVNTNIYRAPNRHICNYSICKCTFVQTASDDTYMPPSYILPSCTLHTAIGWSNESMYLSACTVKEFIYLVPFDPHKIHLNDKTFTAKYFLYAHRPMFISIDAHDTTCIHAYFSNALINFNCENNV